MEELVADINYHPGFKKVSFVDQIQLPVHPKRVLELQRRGAFLVQRGMQMEFHSFSHSIHKSTLDFSTTRHRSELIRNYYQTFGITCVSW